jgi:hypothetical protein
MCHNFIINSLHAHSAILADESYLDSHSFQFVSECHNTSLLDHVIVNQQLLCTLKCYSIQYGLASSDYTPISFIFLLPLQVHLHGGES